MRSKAAVGAGGAAIAAALHIAASAGNPPGLIEDDAVYILLAKSLRHGAFALPDHAGIPITDPFPGLPACLMLPVWLTGENYGLLRLLPLAFAVAALWLVWIAAGRLLSPARAAAATALTALSPALVQHAGLVLPDIALMALGLLAFVGGAADRKSLWFKAAWAAAAAAPLMRPQGALVPAALALVTIGNRSRRVWVLALAPLACWLARNQFAAGTPTAYADHWLEQMGALFPAAGERSLGLLRTWVGWGMLGLGEGWGMLPGLVLAVAAAGARALIRQRAERDLAVLGAILAGSVVLLHLSWPAANPRHVLLILPWLWIFIVGAMPSPPPRLLTGALAAAMAWMAWTDLGIARASLARPRAFQPETMAWIRANVPAGEGIESLRYNAVLLFTGGRALPPDLSVKNWKERTALAQKSNLYWIYQETRFSPGGYVPPGLQEYREELLPKFKDSEIMRPAYRNDREGTRIYELVSARRRDSQ